MTQSYKLHLEPPGIEGTETGWRGLFRFAGSQATSQWVVLPVLGLLALNTTRLQQTDTLEIFLQRMGALFLATVTAWLFFTLCGLLIRWSLRNYSASRIIVIVLLYGATEVVRTSTGYYLTVANGIPEEAEWGFRVTAGALTGLIFFAAASSLVFDARSYRSTFESLHKVHFRLEQSVSQTRKRLLSTREQLVARVRGQIEGAISAGFTNLTQTQDDYTPVVDQLFSVVDQVVRPMSHELFEQPIDIDVEPHDVKAPRVKVHDLIDAATSFQPFLPNIFLVIVLALTLPFALFKGDAGMVLALLLNVAVLYGLLWVCRLTLTPRLGSVGLVTRAVIITVSYAVIVGLFIYMCFIFGLSLTSNVISILTYGTILGVIFGWFAALTTGLNEARRHMLADLRMHNEHLVWLNTRLQSQLWTFQKRLALTLHNKVQGTLLACAMKLKTEMENPRLGLPAALTEVRQSLRDMLEFEFASSQKRKIEDVLAQLSSTWEGVVRVTHVIDATTIRAINRDAVLLQILDDVLGEFLTNALKHGSATEAEFAFALATPMCLQLKLLNNGRPEARSAEEGVGTRFLRSVSLSIVEQKNSNDYGLIIELPIKPNEKSERGMKASASFGQ